MQTIFDIETNGFYQDCTTIHCIALKRIGIDSDVQLYTQSNINDALDILENSEVLIGHNIIQFDIPVLEKFYPSRKFTHNVLDTFNLSCIVFPQRQKHGLEDWGKDLGFEKFNPMTGKEYTDEEWKERKKTKNEAWDKYTSEMGAYCQQDVRVTELVLWQCNVDEIPKSVIELSNKFSWCISQQVINGHKIDTENLLKLNAQIEQDEVVAANELLSKLPSFTDYTFKVYKRANKNKNIKAGDIECIEVVTPFNLSSTYHWMRYLKEKYDFNPPLVRRKGKDEPTPSLDDEVLASIEDKYSEIKDLLLWKTANKIRKMIYNSDNSLYNLLDKDGIIHGKVYTDGTVSGRCSHNKPNLSTMPSVRTDDNGPIKGIKGKYAYEVRNLFIPHDGYVQVGFDAKGLEYMCLAHYINDRHFSVDIIENGDIHTWTQQTLGFETRRQAKTFEYAYLYGAGKKKLAEGLSAGTGVKYTVDDVNKAISKFVEALPGLGTLQDNLKNQYQQKGTITGLDGRELQARSEHSLLNLLLQSSGAVVMKNCLVYLREELSKTDVDYKFTLNVHDEIQASVRPEHVEKYKECVYKAVDRTNKDLGLNCKLQVDIKVGRSWAECH
jgi:DNA polymerase I-like protein with 3'-5' exonuclease and polymerase domains